MENIQAEPVAFTHKAAGEMLARRLSGENLHNAVVVGATLDGIQVASSIAESLYLPLEIILCKNLKDPSDPARNIGSVSAHEMDIHDCPYDLPSDYVYREIARLRHEIETDTKFFYGSGPSARFHYKTVIVVSDMLRSVDTIRACIREIQRQQPLRIIVAIPFISARAASDLKELCDEVIFIRLEQKIKSSDEFFEDRGTLAPEMIRDILKASKNASKISMN